MVNEETIRAECDALKELLVTKNKDYGSSIECEPMFVLNMDKIDAAKVRLGDKVYRLKTLFNERRNGTCESVIDTLIDMAGYCVNLAIMIKDEEQ